MKTGLQINFFVTFWEGPLMETHEVHTFNNLYTFPKHCKLCQTPTSSDNLSY